MKITEKQMEALREIINIGVGKSASMLNTMLNSHIILQVPTLKVFNISELNDELKKERETLQGINAENAAGLYAQNQIILALEARIKKAKELAKYGLVLGEGVCKVSQYQPAVDYSGHCAGFTFDDCLDGEVTHATC